MTQEEKAKAYDKALEIAKSYYGPACNEFLDTIFPELAESEDEKIRKWIITHLENNYKGNYWATQAIAWLEKQKDLNKMIVVSPEVWDNAISDAYENGKKDDEKQKELHYVNKRVDDIMNMPELSAFEQALTNFIGYWEDDEEHWPSQFVKKHGKHILDMAREELQKEQKPVDLPAGFYVTLPDGKKYYTKEMRCNGMNVKVVEPKPAEWSVEDKSFYDSIMCEVIKEGMHPTPEQANWFKLLPERFNLQPKQEWSEEDEKMLNLAIEWAETMSGQCSFVDMDSTDFHKIIAWLKSLRPSKK